MRIRMTGAYDLDRFQDAMDVIVQGLRGNGATEFRSVTIYLQPFHYGRPLDLSDKNTGANIKGLTFEGREKRAFSVFSPRLQADSED